MKKILVALAMASLLTAAFSCVENIDPDNTDPIVKPEPEPEPDPDPDPDPITRAEIDVEWDTNASSYPRWASDSLITSVKGQGTIRYHMSHKVDRAVSSLDVNTQNPRVMGPFEGDCWEFSTPVKAQPGDVICLDFEARASKGSLRYWTLEYLDGRQWKVAGVPETVTASGSPISYTGDYYPGGSGNEFNKVFRGTAVYKNVTDSVVFRFRCVSALQSSTGAILTAANGSSTRLSDRQYGVRPHLYRALEVPQGRGTVCGYVLADGKGVADVVVSDGYEFAKTDGNGFYQMDSKKAHGYVFISVPSGYEVPVNGVIPQFFKHLRAAATDMERVDFDLIAVNNDKFRMYFLGDIHLANNTTTKDSDQYRVFGADISKELTAHGGRQYLTTLGDMSWDAYWYSKLFFYPEYLRIAQEVMPEGTPIFHTIGNHDHDMNASGDWETVLQYKRFIGPTYYSYNIGKVHFIASDNIHCTNALPSMTATGNRTYDCLVDSDQIEWIKKDLSFVPKDVTVIITGHAPLMVIDGSNPDSGQFSLQNAQELVNCFSGRTVHFVTGHTHKTWNQDRLSATSTSYFEHNAGAVCGAWWRTYAAGGIHLAPDGVPGGYQVFDFDGKDMKWFFKGTGHDEEDQVETFDLNECVLGKDQWIPNCTKSDFITQWDKYTAYSGSHAVNFQQKNENQVLLHVWNYDPSWKIEITERETGKKLTAKRIRSYSPIYLATYTAVAYNSNGSTPSDPYSSQNMFLVEASAANTTLDIKLTDRSGRVFQESMTRPRAFSVKAYM